MKNIVAVVQARTGSTRFPGKIFADIQGMPLIWHILTRIRFSKKINHVVVATTVNPLDDIIEEWAIKNKVALYRGSEDDVLDRYYNAAKKFNADVIVRITADDPFKDPEIIDKVIDMLLSLQLDFAYNNNPPSFPEGLDTEVFTYKALQIAHANAKDSFEREHVTQYFYRNPSIFKQSNFPYSINLSHLRWTLDTNSDYEMTKEIYRHLYTPNKIFLMKDILQLLRQYPAIAEINSGVKRSAMYN